VETVSTGRNDVHARKEAPRNARFGVGRKRVVPMAVGPSLPSPTAPGRPLPCTGPARRPRPRRPCSPAPPIPASLAAHAVAHNPLAGFCWIYSHEPPWVPARRGSSHTPPREHLHCGSLLAHAAERARTRRHGCRSPPTSRWPVDRCSGTLSRELRPAAMAVVRRRTRNRGIAAAASPARPRCKLVVCCLTHAPRRLAGCAGVLVVLAAQDTSAVRADCHRARPLIQAAACSSMAAHWRRPLTLARSRLPVRSPSAVLTRPRCQLVRHHRRPCTLSAVLLPAR
jgi:hypothetical protein